MNEYTTLRTFTFYENIAENCISWRGYLCLLKTSDEKGYAISICSGMSDWGYKAPNGFCFYDVIEFAPIKYIEE